MSHIDSIERNEISDCIEKNHTNNSSIIPCMTVMIAAGLRESLFLKPYLIMLGTNKTDNKPIRSDNIISRVTSP